jgi:hypothetical protein
MGSSHHPPPEKKGGGGGMSFAAGLFAPPFSENWQKKLCFLFFSFFLMVWLFSPCKVLRLFSAKKS